MLTGTEVKSLREGRASLADGFAQISDGELWLYNVHIPEYTEGTWNNHAPRRTASCCCTVRRSRSCRQRPRSQGLTLVPLELYFKDGKAKVELGAGAGQAELRQAARPGGQGRSAEGGGPCAPAATVTGGGRCPFTPVTGGPGSHARTGRSVRIVLRPGRSTAPPPNQRPPLPPRPPSARSQQKAHRLSMRARRIRLVAVVVFVGIVVAGFMDGFGQESSPSGTVQAFLLDWQQHNYRAAAGHTTGTKATVASALSGAFTQLDATAMFLSMGSLQQHGDTAEAHFTASVNLGEGGHQWEYQGRFALQKTGSGWKIVWAPRASSTRSSARVNGWPW